MDVCDIRDIKIASIDHDERVSTSRGPGVVLIPTPEPSGVNGTATPSAGKQYMDVDDAMTIVAGSYSIVGKHDPQYTMAIFKGLILVPKVGLH